MPEQTNDKITFYNSSNIPLPALTEKADTQELQDELLVRRLNLAFNLGREFERAEIVQSQQESEEFVKMQMDQRKA